MLNFFSKFFFEIVLKKSILSQGNRLYWQWHLIRSNKISMANFSFREYFLISFLKSKSKKNRQIHFNLYYTQKRNCSAYDMYQNSYSKVKKKTAHSVGYHHYIIYQISFEKIYVYIIETWDLHTNAFLCGSNRLTMHAIENKYAQLV